MSKDSYVDHDEESGDFFQEVDIHTPEENITDDSLNLPPPTIEQTDFYVIEYCVPTKNGKEPTVLDARCLPEHMECLTKPWYFGSLSLVYRDYPKLSLHTKRKTVDAPIKYILELVLSVSIVVLHPSTLQGYSYHQATI